MWEAQLVSISSPSVTSILFFLIFFSFSYFLLPFAIKITNNSFSIKEHTTPHKNYISHNQIQLIYISQITRFTAYLRSQDSQSIHISQKSCDAPGFHPEYLTLMRRSTVLTLVKRWSTWAITSKTSPTTPNHPFWTTLVNPWSNPTQNPLNTPLPSSVSRNFCHVLRISPKHFKIPQCKSCVFCRGTQLSCWAAFQNWSGNVWKNASQRLQTLFTGVEFSTKFSGVLCKIGWSKPYTPFLEVIEGQEIYNFGY
jgi:hypothetical protein